MANVNTIMNTPNITPSAALEYANKQTNILSLIELAQFDRITWATEGGRKSVQKSEHISIHSAHT